MINGTWPTMLIYKYINSKFTTFDISLKYFYLITTFVICIIYCCRLCHYKFRDVYNIYNI